MSEQKEVRTNRFTDTELAWIKNTFGTEESLMMLRKIFLPGLDATTPIGMLMDAWTSLPLKEMGEAEAVRLVQARNNMINHTETQLVMLRALASDTTGNVAEKIKKNSSK